MNSIFSFYNDSPLEDSVGNASFTKRGESSFDFADDINPPRSVVINGDSDSDDSDVSGAPRKSIRPVALASKFDCFSDEDD